MFSARGDEMLLKTFAFWCAAHRDLFQLADEHSVSLGHHAKVVGALAVVMRVTLAPAEWKRLRPVQTSLWDIPKAPWWCVLIWPR